MENNNRNDKIEKHGLGPVGGQRPPFVPPKTPSTEDKDSTDSGSTKTDSGDTKKE